MRNLTWRTTLHIPIYEIYSNQCRKKVSQYVKVQPLCIC
jgi:hypothetical protein